jgi:hypothetical protein
LIVSLLATYSGTIAPKILSQCINTVGDLLPGGYDMSGITAGLCQMAFKYFGFSFLNGI